MSRHNLNCLYLIQIHKLVNPQNFVPIESYRFYNLNGKVFSYVGGILIIINDSVIFVQLRRKIDKQVRIMKFIRRSWS